MDSYFKLSIEGYVPEPTFWESKQQISSRLCREHCAVIEIRAGYRILAARGADLEIGADLREVLHLTATEREVLDHACLEETRSLVIIGGKPMLILSDWRPHLGLCLVILPDCDENAARYALCNMGRTDINLVPPTRKSPAEACRQAHAILADILSYTDAILQTAFAPEGDPRLIFRIAAFAGCRLDGETAYTLSLRGFPIRSTRSAAFLLCALLDLRGREGKILANSPNNATVRYRMSIRSKARLANGTLSAAPLYASASCFRDCRLQTDETGALLIVLPSEFADSLAAGPFGAIEELVLCIEQIFPDFKEQM